MAYVAYCLDPIVVGEVAGVDSPTVPQCLSGWVTSVYVPPFDPSQIDPSVVVAMFSGGFLLYLTPWAAAWGFSQLLKLLR